MQFVITSVVLALQLVSASVLPRDGLEYSELTGIEPFNTTFALEHLVEDGTLEGTQSLTERQASGAVFYCINANWGPACEYRYMPKDQCVTFQAPWQDSISSFGPDPGVWCHLFEHSNCNENGRVLWNVQNPGIDNLDTIGWNDILTSVRCWW